MALVPIIQTGSQSPLQGRTVWEAGVRVPAALVLGRIGKPAEAELIKAWNNENHVVRGRCKGNVLLLP